MTVFGWDQSDYDPDRPVPAGLGFATNKVTEGTTVVHGSYARRLPAWRGVVPVLGAYHVLRTPGSGGNGSLSAQLDYWYGHMDAVPWWRDVPWIEQLDVERWPYDNVSVVRAAGRPLFHHEAVTLLEPAHLADLQAQRASTTLDFCRLWQGSGTASRKIIYASRGQYGSSLSGAPFDFWNAHYVGGYPGDSSSDWDPYSGPVAFLQYTSTPYDKDAYRGSLNDLLNYVGGNGMLSDPNADDIIPGIGNATVLADIWHATVGQVAGNDPDGGRFRSPNRYAEILKAVGQPQPITLTPDQLTQLEAALGPAVHAELAKVGVTLTVAP